MVIQRDGRPRPSFVAHRGSCFAFLSSEWFLTASHVVDGLSVDELGVALYIEHTIADETGWDVAAVHKHDEADVALLHVPEWGFKVFDPFAGVSGHLEAGDEIRCFGYPAQTSPEGQPLVPRMIRGYIQRRFLHTSPLGYNYVAMELSNPAPAGLSGAPVSREDELENVVGLVAESFESATLLHRISEVVENGEVFREEMHAVVTFGIAVDLRPLDEWIREVVGRDA